MLDKNYSVIQRHRIQEIGEWALKSNERNQRMTAVQRALENQVRSSQQNEDSRKKDTLGKEQRVGEDLQNTW